MAINLSENASGKAVGELVLLLTERDEWIKHLVEMVEAFEGEGRPRPPLGEQPLGVV